MAAEAVPRQLPSTGQLGMLAHNRGDYDEAERQYQRAFGISERLGNQAGMATTCGQLGILEAERGGPANLTPSRLA